MKTGLKNFSSTFWAMLVPLLSIMILVIILYIPRGIGYWNFLRQAPFYAGIYFWQSQRPDAFNFLSAFVLGVIADVLGGLPLGINITSFLALYLLSIRIIRHFNIQRFSYSWFWFFIAVLITMIFKSAIVSALYRRIIPINPLLFELSLTIALYPICARFYIWSERRFIHLEERYEKV